MRQVKLRDLNTRPKFVLLGTLGAAVTNRGRSVKFERTSKAQSPSFCSKSHGASAVRVADPRLLHAHWEPGSGPVSSLGIVYFLTCSGQESRSVLDLPGQVPSQQAASAQDSCPL